MKKITFLLLCLSFLNSMHLMAQPGDSVIIKREAPETNNGRDDDDGGLNINLSPRWNEKSRDGFPKKLKTRWLMLDFGFNTYIYNGSLNLPNTMAPFEQRIGKSTHWGLHVYQQRVRLGKTKHFFLYHGLGFDFYHYNFVSDQVMQPRQEQVTFDTVANVRNNRLMTSFLQVPLMFQYRTGNSWKSFRVSAGMYGGLLLGANLKVKTTDGSDKIADDYNLNRFRYGIRGEVGFGPLNFYCMYSLNSMFRQDQGPELYPLTIGIRLIPF